MMSFLLDIRQQGRHTPRHDILKYSRYPNGYVIIDGEKLEINAKIYQLSGYSAHADQADLVAWVKQFSERPSKLKLVHGDDDAQAALYNILNI